MNKKDLLLTPEKVESVLQETQVVKVNALQIEDGLRIAQAQIDKAIPLVREEALIEGITMYAWWKDGVQYVGATGRTLKEAIAEIKSKK